MSTVDGQLGTTGPRAGFSFGRLNSGSARDRFTKAGASVTGARWGRLGLAAVLLSGVLISLAAVDTNPLLPQSTRPVTSPLAGPLASLSFHMRAGEIFVVLTLMFVGYLLAVRNAAYLSPRMVIATVTAFIVMVLLAPTLFSTDVFSYQAYASEFFTYHVNPYTTGTQVLDAGPLYSGVFYPLISAKWINTPTVYGPLFTLISGLFSNVSSNGAIAFGVYAYKLIAAASAGGTLFFIWKSAKLRGIDPVRGVLIFGLNPLVVCYGIGGGHNDLLMLVFSSAGIWALLAGRQRTGGALAVTSAAVKLTGGLMLPFFLAANPGIGAGPRRRKVLLGAVLAAVVSLGVGISVFGTNMLHMLNTLDQVQGEGGWQSAPGFLQSVLGWREASHVISTLFGVGFVLICCRLLWNVAKGKLDWLDGAAWATLWLLIATSSILPWYVSWLMVPAALCLNRRASTAALWFSGWVLFTTMLGYVPNGQSILGL